MKLTPSRWLRPWKRECSDAIPGPSEVERLLSEGVDSGQVVRCDGAEVPAELLRSLLTTELRPSGRRPHALRLQDAQIAGPLDLDSSTLTCPVSLENCRFDHSVTLNEAQAPSVRLERCKLPALHARQLTTRGDLALQGLEARQVLLAGARIGGVLGLSQAKLTPEGGLALDGSRLHVQQEMDCRGMEWHGEVHLAGAQIAGALSLDGAPCVNKNGPALRADGPRIKGAMRDERGFAACGELCLVDAHIGGTLSLGRAQLISPEGSALRADRLQVGGAMLCQKGFVARGEVRLLGARIAGQLSLDGASLSNPGHQALLADQLQVAASMFCREGFRARGEVRLRNAHVAGALSFSGARLANTGGSALNADGLRVDGAMLGRRGFRARGQVRLVGARIARELNLNDADLAVADRAMSVLDLSGLSTAALWLPTRPSHGVIDLTGAQVGTLRDPAWQPPGSETDKRPYSPRLAGFVYESLAPGTDNLATRLDWIEHAQEGYSPHAYDQLEAALRRAGSEKEAREVAIAKRRRRRKKLPPHAVAWDMFLDMAVGYGYRTWRSLYALLVVMAIGWAVFACASWDHLRAAKIDGQRPDFAPWLYSLDSVLPVINLGQEAAWTPTGFALYWYVFSVLTGWILATALIAAVTAGIARK